MARTRFLFCQRVAKVPHTGGGTDKLQRESRGCRVGPDAGRPRPRSAAVSAGRPSHDRLLLGPADLVAGRV